MTWFTLLLWIAAAGLWFAHRMSRAWFEELRAIKPYQAAALIEAIDEVSRELGAGSYQAHVALCGQPLAAQPLEAPASKTACLYYDVRVERVFDEVVEDEDAQGKRRRRVVTRHEELTRHTESVPFDLRDETGSVRVLQAGAQYEGLLASKVFFVPVEALGAGRGDGGRGDGGRGGYRLPWPWLPVSRAESPLKATVGYRCREHILPCDVEHLTVIGEASDGRGEVVIRHDRKPLIISTLPREALEDKARAQARWLGVGAKAASAVAVAWMIVGWVRG
jgi:hypothetical protein